MSPTLIPGDWAVAVAARELRRGDVVALEHPGRPGLEIVKRVTAIGGDRILGDRLIGPDELWVEGDASDRSTDSRSFGPVDRGAVVGAIRLVYWPPGRQRVLRARG